MTKVKINGIAHITGGGLTENVPRILHSDLHATIQTSSWQPDPIFDWLATQGNIAIDEMLRTFNCGIGMVVVVDSADAGTTIELLADCGESAWRAGTIVNGGGEVEYV